MSEADEALEWADCLDMQCVLAIQETNLLPKKRRMHLKLQ